MKGNPVRFIYISAGKSRPTPIDPDAIYFLEGEKQIWVGNVCIADSVEPVDVASYLYPYRVKDITVSGEGEVLSSAELNDETGVITFTRSALPAIQKGTSPDPQHVDLNPGDTFDAIVNQSVSGHTIYDEHAIFRLPVQISAVSITTDSSSSTLQLIVSKSDGTSVEQDIQLGSAAFTDTSDYATASQGAKADAAMPAVDGTATGAHISLAADPVSEMDAATKQYVDNLIADLGTVFNYRGDSSTPITDGGREEPTIDGEPIDPTQGMKKGDVVTYNGQEFLWNGSSWQAFGSSGPGGSEVPATRQILAGQGLSGGGALSSDVTLNHGSTGTGAEESYIKDATGVSSVSGIVVDKFGHVQDVEYADLTPEITDLVDDLISQSADDVLAQAQAYVDEQIAQVADYTIVSVTPEQGYEYTYRLQKDGEDVGDPINIPSPSIIKSSSIETVEETDVPYPGAQIGDKYIDFETGDGADDHIYIPVSDIGAVYTAGPGITINNEVISHANIGDGSDIGYSELAASGDDANTFVLSQKILTRDSMGHVTGYQSSEESTSVELLSKEGVRQMILEYVPTWIIEAAQAEHANG